MTSITLSTNISTDTLTIATDFSSYPVYADSFLLTATSSAYTTTGSWDVIVINGNNVELPAPVDSDSLNTTNLALVTLGVENQSTKGFVNIGIRLYNDTQSTVLSNSTMTWTGYLDDNGFDTASTLFTYQIPIGSGITAQDIIQVQVIDLNSLAPNITNASYTLMAKSAAL